MLRVFKAGTVAQWLTVGTEDKHFYVLFPIRDRKEHRILFSCGKLHLGLVHHVNRQPDSEFAAKESAP